MVSMRNPPCIATMVKDHPGWGRVPISLHASLTCANHNVQEYLSQAQRTLNNIEDGFYISPAFLDKLSIHVAKNFLDLPKIKVPLILGEQPCTKRQAPFFTPGCLFAHKQLCVAVSSLH